LTIKELNAHSSKSAMTHATSVLHFWFEELTPKQHFVKDAALDETIRTRFGDTPRAFAQDALALFTQLGNENNLSFVLRHKAIIDRFGRYPHRNAILGRSSSAQELAFLAEPGSSF
jgi:uncharacterized protein (DUF924 family)